MSGEQLLQHLVASGVLRTPRIMAAFRAIDRRNFVPMELRASAYADTALPLMEGQTISQPTTVAFMLELLQPAPGQIILDVGSGSGWQTALLATLVGEAGHVVALEIRDELCEMGRRTVSQYNFLARGVVEMRCQSGYDGYPDRAPYDGIIAAAAGEAVPPAWLTQVGVGGHIVVPLRSSIWRLTRTAEATWQREEYPGFAFVPLVSS